MLFFESPKIEVGKDVAQQNEAAKGIPFQHAGRGARATDLRAQVHVGQNQRVINCRLHTTVITKPCYRAMKCALERVQQGNRWGNATRTLVFTRLDLRRGYGAWEVVAGMAVAL